MKKPKNCAKATADSPLKDAVKGANVDDFCEALDNSPWLGPSTATS